MRKNNQKKLMSCMVAFLLGISFSNLSIFADDTVAPDYYNLAPQDDVCVGLYNDYLQSYSIDGYNFNAYNYDYVGRYDRSIINKSALRFDLSSIDKNIISAKLKIKLTDPIIEYDQRPLSESYNTDISLYGNTEDWSLLPESAYGGVYDISPNFPMEDESTLLYQEKLGDIEGEGDDWKVFDVTDYVSENQGGEISFLFTADTDDLNFCFASNGNPNPGWQPQLVITTEDKDSIIEETSGSFDKNSDSENCKDIDIGLTLNGNTFEIKNGDTLLNKDIDYILSEDGTTVTLLKEYLSSLSNGDTILTIDFSAEEDQIFTVNVTDSTPPDYYNLTPQDDVCVGLYNDYLRSYSIDGYNFNYYNYDYVGRYDRSIINKSALRFDLSSVDKNIISAKLKIKLTDPIIEYDHRPLSESYNTDVSLYGNTEDWSLLPEAGYGGVYDISPNFPMEDESTMLYQEKLGDIEREGDDWKVFDVTDYVIANQEMDISFLFTADTDDLNFCFASNGNPNPGWQPQLVITAQGN